MNDQDRDLIASLAEGRLSGSAAEDALSRIEADPEFASEYAAQIAAIDFLDSAITPIMTAAERETLHANLADQLGLEPATPVVVPEKHKTPWWQPVFGLATAAAVVAAVVILPGTFGGADSADVAAVRNFDEEEASTSTQESLARGDTELTDESDGADQSLPEDATLSVYKTESVELERLLTQAKGADSPDSVSDRLAPLGFTSKVDLDEEQVQACINDLDAELPDGIISILVLGADVTDEATVVSLGFDFGEGVEDGLSFVLHNCSLVAYGPQG
ncbi:MAG: hypothetical protein ABFR95_07000 [Actinomycetota bacterium]